MSKIVGIDLGTTNSLIATVDSGIPLVIADASGSRLTPSVVHYPRDGGDPKVGHVGQRMRVVDPERTLYSIKRFMGRRGSEIGEEELDVSYRVDGSGPGGVRVDIQERTVSPEEVSAEILRKLKRDAEGFLGEPVTRAVITVPAYFNDAQRSATKQAGELAGFVVERIINEPTAAALAYGLGQIRKGSKIAVYDLGGGTFDLSILELNEGTFQVLATHGNTRLGGNDIDRRLFQWVWNRIQELHPHLGERTPQMDARLLEEVEQAKILLSSETEVKLSMPFFSEQVHVEMVITRTELERLALEVVLKTRDSCRQALGDAQVEAKDLDQVILVGGQTRMPMVRRLVSEWFGCREFEETRGEIRLGTEYHATEGPLLNTSQNPDEAVALGAAIQAEILSGGFQNILLLDVTPLSLGLETFGGLMNVIIPRNSTIPVKAGEVFTTAMDFQKEMMIHVLQGERERSADNWSLGRLTVAFQPAPRGVARVGVQFELDVNGILHVLARDIQTGKDTVLEIRSAVDVDDARVQQMVDESVEHAFDDLEARQWVEAKLRAIQTVEATGKALNDFRGQIEGEYLAEIERDLAEVQRILAESGEGTGSAKELKQALKTLDQTTQPLAEHMMDLVREAMLKKKGLL